ncbi:MAG: dynamin family protein [Gammaproteobacteria bacterium]
MQTDSLTHSFSSYQEWREHLASTVSDIQAWLSDNDQLSPEQELRLFESVDALRKDQLTIAFVAEFSRGKTELINALFFAEFGRRLLPSEAGRTTMCPTELFYDQATDDAYIMLLPISTRRQEKSISELKQESVEWSRIALDMDSPKQIATALEEVIRTDNVSVDTARELGFYHEDLDPYYQKHGAFPETVEIPHWRHAMISFPHPLLKSGLVILDTPGLNALGNEPELTISMLPAAQSILFILGADTGVTRSDLDIWEHHIKANRQQNNDRLTVVLNKIDTLWDELKSEEDIRDIITVQKNASAEELGVPVEQVFPISAQKALVAKVQKNAALLTASHLPELETYLTETVIPARKDIVQKNILDQIIPVMNEQITIASTSSEDIQEQIDELNSIRGKNADVIMHLVNKTQQEQDDYLASVQTYQDNRRLLQAQGTRLLNTLSIDGIDVLISNTRQEMKNSWTTVGIKRGMEAFFDGTRDAMRAIAKEIQATSQLVNASYEKFHIEHGLPKIAPTQFEITPYITELERLYQEAEDFRRSPITVVAEQQFVIKKFFISLVSHTRNLFYKAGQDAELWLKEVMNPLIKQIKGHKVSMDKRLTSLKRISHSRDTIDIRLQELETSQIEIAKQTEELEAMLARLTTGKPVSQEASIAETLPQATATESA